MLFQAAEETQSSFKFSIDISSHIPFLKSQGSAAKETSGETTGKSIGIVWVKITGYKVGERLCRACRKKCYKRGPPAANANNPDSWHRFMGNGY